MNPDQPPKLSEAEIAQVVALLNRLTPGFLPFDIFHQVARLVALPIIEVVPVRHTTAGKVEVLLLRREADDPAWPGQLHVPGTVVRSSDRPGSFQDALGRILEGELAGATTSEPVFVKNLLHRQARGAEVTQVFWVEVRSEPAAGTFYPSDALPGSLVSTQLHFIPDAVAAYVTYKDADKKTGISEERMS